MVGIFHGELLNNQMVNSFTQNQRSGKVSLLSLGHDPDLMVDLMVTNISHINSPKNPT